MQNAANLLQNIGFLLYAGPMVAFAILVAVRDRTGLAPWEILRVYRAWGAGFGLSLGATVFGGLARYWLDHGSFTWGWDTPAETITLATFVAFLVMWASNIKLEIWSLEPMRRLDRGGQVSDEAAYRAAAARFSRHLSFQGVLCVLVAALATLSGVA